MKNIMPSKIRTLNNKIKGSVGVFGDKLTAARIIKIMLKKYVYEKLKESEPNGFTPSILFFLKFLSLILCLPRSNSPLIEEK